MAQSGGRLIMSLAKVREALAALVAASQEELPPEEAIESVPEETPEAAAPEGEQAEEAAAPPPPLVDTNHAKKGFHLDVTVAPDQVVQAAEILDGEKYTIEAVTGVDWIKEEQMEVVYDYCDTADFSRVVIRARIPRATPELPTISRVFPGADWHERETHDFFGITFVGHPDLSPLLLPEDADYHPLLKDFTA